MFNFAIVIFQTDMKTLKLLILMSVVMNSLSACADKGQAGLLEPRGFVTFIESNPEVVLVDVRTLEEFTAGHIAGAVNVDWEDDEFLEDFQGIVPASRPVALYCRSGRRSAEAASVLQGKGYTVSDLDGGVLAWQKYGLPLTDGKRDFYETPSGKTVAVEPLIHASLRITFGELEIEVDPVGEMGDRVTDYSRFPKADIILVTHEHHDHLDPGAIKTLEKSDTVVIANRRSADILGFGKVMANGDRLTVDGVEIEAVPAYNTTPERLQFHPQGRDNGYVLNLDGLRIYIAGDTEVTPEMSMMKDIDVAFLPCNLPYTMTPAQLIEAAEAIRPKVVYPYHYGTTDLSSITPALAPEGIYVRICPFDPGATH